MEQVNDIIRSELTLRLCYDDVEDASFIKVRVIIKEAKSYEVFVEAMILYLMGFTLDF